MQEQSGIKKDFDALCNQYGGIPEGGKCHRDLWHIFLYRRQGMYLTDFEAERVFPAPEIARMLKQLSFSSGAFSLMVGSARKDYFSPELVEVLKKSLEDALQAMVIKYPEMLNVTYGKDGDRMIGWEYPTGEVPQEDGFSEVELDMIIEMGVFHNDLWKKFAGNAQSKGKASTRNPALGQFVNDLSGLLPEEWNDATKNAFLADYLCLAGFLDFKGKAWVENFKEKLKEDKDRQVRRWIEAYEKVRADNPSILGL